MEKTPRNSIEEIIKMFDTTSGQKDNVSCNTMELESENSEKKKKKSLSIHFNDEVPEKRKRKSSSTEGVPETKVGIDFTIKYQSLENIKTEDIEINSFVEKSPIVAEGEQFTKEMIDKAIVVNYTRNGVEAMIGNESVILKKEEFIGLFNCGRAIVIYNLLEQLKLVRNQIGSIVESFVNKCVLYDAYIAASVIDPGSVDDKTFNQMCVIYDVPIINDSSIEKLKRTKEMALKEIEIMETYKLLDVFQKQEMPISGIIIEMNFLTEFKINSQLLFQQRKALIERKNQIEQESRKLLGKSINLGSSDQVKKELKKLGIGLDGAKKKNTTDKKILSQVDHPFAKVVLDYRKVAKFLSGVVEQIRNCCVKTKDDCFIRTTWSQTSIVTGRIQSRNPNLQQLQKQRFEIPQMTLSARDLFIAHDNKTFVAIDYNQIELRILADFTNDKHLIEFFNSNADVHKLIAAHWLKKKCEDVTEDERRKAKTIVYGCIYGIGPYSLADQLHVSVEESKTFLKTFLEQFPSFEEWKKETLNKARVSGFVYTLNNRRRRINHLLDEKDQKSVAEAERMAVNSPIQGSAADIIKMCMIEVFNKCHSEWEGVKMMLNIHDEIVLEVPDVLLNEVCVTLKELMENIVHLKVPLIVTVGIGKEWGTLRSYNFESK